MRIPRGFSLTEAILATFLVGLFLIVLSGLTSSLRRVSQFSDQRAAMAELRTLLGEIRAELTEAVEVTHPSAGNSAKIQLLRLRRETLIPDPATTARLNQPPATAVSYYWNPVDPAYLEQVLYDLDGKTLQRKVGSGIASPVGTVESFQARVPETGMIEVRIEVLSSKGREVLKSLVDRR